MAAWEWYSRNDGTDSGPLYIEEPAPLFFRDRLGPPWEPAAASSGLFSGPSSDLSALDDTWPSPPLLLPPSPPLSPPFWVDSFPEVPDVSLVLLESLQTNPNFLEPNPDSAQPDNGSSEALLRQQEEAAAFFDESHGSSDIGGIPECHMAGEGNASGSLGALFKQAVVMDLSLPSCSRSPLDGCSASERGEVSDTAEKEVPLDATSDWLHPQLHGVGISPTLAPSRSSSAVAAELRRQYVDGLEFESRRSAASNSSVVAERDSSLSPSGLEQLLSCPLIVRAPSSTEGAFSEGSRSSDIEASQQPAKRCDCAECQVSGLNLQHADWAAMSSVYNANSTLHSSSSTSHKSEQSDDSEKHPQQLLAVASSRETRPKDMSNRLAALVEKITKPPLESNSGVVVQFRGSGRKNSDESERQKEAEGGPFRIASEVDAWMKAKQEVLTSRREGTVQSLQVRRACRKLRRRRPAMDGTLTPSAATKVVMNPFMELAFPPAAVVDSFKIVDKRKGGDSTLRQHLLSYAEAVATHDEARMRFLLKLLKKETSSRGTTMQRLAFFFMEALTARVANTGAEIFFSKLNVQAEDIAFALEAGASCTPYVRLAFEAANASIVDSVRGERAVHVVDLGMWQGGQFASILRQLAAQPGGPPSVHLTCVDAAWNANPLKEAMTTRPAVIGRDLTKLAASLGIPFEFSVVKTQLEELQPEMIRREAGEVVVVTSAMRLSYLYDGGVVRSSPRDALLQRLRLLSPHRIVVVESDADLNGPFFLERFREALDYFGALFASFEGIALRRDGAAHWERLARDKFGRDITSVVACEGVFRVIRYERLSKWQARFARHGFNSVPCASPELVRSLEKMLVSFPAGYSLQPHEGALQIMFQERPILCVSVYQ